jgi:hypothetical protein
LAGIWTNPPAQTGMTNPAASAFAGTVAVMRRVSDVVPV